MYMHPFVNILNKVLTLVQNKYTLFFKCVLNHKNPPEVFLQN